MTPAASADLLRAFRPFAFCQINHVPNDRHIFARLANREDPRQLAPLDIQVQLIPESGDTVGWWDGSSYVGDPYGATVIAGHVDTVERGIGFFFRLWNIQVGERVVLSAGHRRQAYKITSLRQVPRTDLVD